MDTLGGLWLILACLGILTFAFVLIHALRWLARPGTTKGPGFLSRAHAKRRVVSAALVVFALLWLLGGMTRFRGIVFSLRNPLAALVFMGVLSAVVIAVLVLAWIDFREAARAYRRDIAARKEERTQEIIQSATGKHRGDEDA